MSYVPVLSRWIPSSLVRVLEKEQLQHFAKPFGFSIATTFLSMVFSVTSNKVVAVWGGPEQSALVAVFRQLYAGISQGLSFGADVTLLQAVSADTSSKNVSKIVTIILWYLLLAVCGVSLVVVLFSRGITVGLFGARAEGEHVLEVQIVLFMSVIGLALIFVTAILNGFVQIRKVLLLNVVSSLVTALAAYFLITKLHSLGTAILVGFGNVIALVLGLWYLRGHVHFRELRAHVLVSDALKFAQSGTILTGLNILSVVVVLIVQAIVARGYGLSNLGLFTASYTIMTTFMMLFMSPMKVYVLPTLGRLLTSEARNEFINQTVRVALIMVFPFAVLLFAAKGLAVQGLYSSEFDRASELLGIETLGVIPRALAWVLAIYVLSAGLYSTYMIADLLRAGVIVMGCSSVVAADFPLASINWVFFTAYLVDVAVYLAFATRQLGFRLTWSIKVMAVAMAVTMALLYAAEI